MKGVLEEVNEGREVGEGGWGFVDWFNSTDGGELSTLLAKREKVIEELMLNSVQLFRTMAHITLTR